jgi:hypothetical protein
MSPAQRQLVSDPMQTWAIQHQAQPSELGTRVTYVVTIPRVEGSGPECDFAIPLS